MNPPKELKIRFNDFSSIVALAWCGVNDGAGRDEDIERVLHRLEQMNPEYHAFRKEERRIRHEERLAATRAAKAFARENLNKDLWYTNTRLSYGKEYGYRVKVRVLRSKDDLIEVKAIGHVESLSSTTFVDHTWVRTRFEGESKHVVSAERLKPLDSQFGEPKHQKTQVIYQPGNGVRRVNGSLGR